MPSATRLRKIEQLRARDGDRCWLCGGTMLFHGPQRKLSGTSATLDHVVERRNGGSTRSLENLRLAHRNCNNARDTLFPHTAGPQAPGQEPGYPHPNLPSRKLWHVGPSDGVQREPQARCPDLR